MTPNDPHGARFAHALAEVDVALQDLFEKVAAHAPNGVERHPSRFGFYWPAVRECICGGAFRLAKDRYETHAADAAVLADAYAPSLSDADESDSDPEAHLGDESMEIIENSRQQSRAW